MMSKKETERFFEQILNNPLEKLPQKISQTEGINQALNYMNLKCKKIIDINAVYSDILQFLSKNKSLKLAVVSNDKAQQYLYNELQNVTIFNALPNFDHFDAIIALNLDFQTELDAIIDVLNKDNISILLSYKSSLKFIEINCYIKDSYTHNQNQYTLCFIKANKS